MGKEVPILV